MSDPVVIDLFAEDRAHEEFLNAVLHRLAREAHACVRIRPRACRGGHGKALTEFKMYQRIALRSGVAGDLPDGVVVAIDANCRGAAAATGEIRGSVDAPFQDRVAIACPDPHVEIWFLADPAAVGRAVGAVPTVGRRKCKRDRYKTLLAQTIRDAGFLPTLGGIEFAADIVAEMDWYEAGRNQPSFKHFLDEARAFFREVR